MSRTPAEPDDLAKAGPLRVAELAETVRRAAPDAFLVLPRVLRRAIRSELGGGWIGWAAPHRRVFVLPAARAREVIEPHELGLKAAEPWPRWVILLERPRGEWLTDAPAPDVLLDYWRRLFHARAHVRLRERVESGALTAAVAQSRIDRIGQVEFDEARSVLTEDRYLTRPRDPIEAYIEFAAVYLELRQFAPTHLPDTFPSLTDPVRIDMLLAADVDVIALLEQSRLPGAAVLAPAEPVEVGDEDEPGPSATSDLDARVGTSGEGVLGARPWSYGGLRARASRAEARGNLVRAALHRHRASRLLPAALQPAARREASRDIQRLARRLGAPLELTQPVVNAWSRALTPLLERASRGRWSPEARLLYDLQKIAEEHEREIYTVDPIAWLLSRGRRPLKRPLPNHRVVLRVNHLRSVRRRLARVHLGEADRDVLVRLVQEALSHAEGALRDQFRPRLFQTLTAQGWGPRNLPEAVARDKLIEELLDRIVERGFIVMGDLRDAISRGDLKLPDRSDTRKNRHGDPLLATDRALGLSLDGVYRRGEVYLRWLQHLSASLFGTVLGRVLTKYLAIPFVGAFVVLKGHDYLLEELAHFIHFRPYHIFHWSSFLVLAFFLEGVLHSPSFRIGLRRLVGRAGRLARLVFVEFPRWALCWPPLAALIRSKAFAWLSRWLFRPAIAAVLIYAILPRIGVARSDAAILAAIAYAIAALLFNSRPGRDLEEIVSDQALQLWQRFYQEFIPGLYRLIMETSTRFLESVERLLYAIDEWLRFRGGQGRFALAIKAVLGMAWFVVTYVVRFAVNLVIEPQVNPIKHFPVVTVAHKVMLPLILALKSSIESSRLGQSGWVVWIVIGALQFVPPGIVGFLVWEFKANWRLYAANRPSTLRPAVIGHHGETLARLLRPGFHSGTLPRLFAKLRRADQTAAGLDRRSPARRSRERLHHVELSLRHFTERELIALLTASRALDRWPIRLGRALVGTNRVQLSLVNERVHDRVARIAFEEQSGWLVATIQAAGWLDELSETERAAFRDALAGFYKRAGIDLVREQVQAVLVPASAPYDIEREGLVVWLGGPDQEEVRIPLSGVGLDPPVVSDRAPAKLVYSSQPLEWDHWVEIWERRHSGDRRAGPAVEGVRFLPEPPRLVRDVVPSKPEPVI